MDIAFLLKGLAIGLAIAAPVGPIGLLCISRTLTHGRLIGLACGLGAATADAVYASIAAFGLTLVSDALTEHQDSMRLIGGLFLCHLALRALLTASSQAAVPRSGSGLATAYGSTFLLTLTNPATILSFAAVFAGLNIAAEEGRNAPAIGLVLGVFLGSALWWVLLSGGIGMLRVRLAPRGLRWLNLVSAAVLGGFGLAALVSIAF